MAPRGRAAAQRLGGADEVGALRAALEAGRGLDLRAVDAVCADVEEMMAAGRPVPDKPATFGAALVQLAQACAKACAKACAAKAGDDGALLEALGLAMARAVAILDYLRPGLTFKSELAVEMLAQKCAAALLDAAEWEAAYGLLEQALSQLVRRGKLVSAPNDEEDSPDGGVLDAPLEFGPGSDRQLCQLVVFCTYNCCRCLVELERFEAVWRPAKVNLGPWVKRLADLDRAKAKAFAESVVALLFHHAPGRLEKLGQPEAAFQARTLALEVGEQTGGLAAGKENDSRGSACADAGLNSLTASAGSLLRAASGPEEKRRRLELVEAAYEARCAASDKCGLLKGSLGAVMLFLEHFATVQASLGRRGNAAATLELAYRHCEDAHSLAGRALVLVQGIMLALGASTDASLEECHAEDDNAGGLLVGLARAAEADNDLAASAGDGDSAIARLCRALASVAERAAAAGAHPSSGRESIGPGHKTSDSKLLARLGRALERHCASLACSECTTAQRCVRLFARVLADFVAAAPSRAAAAALRNAAELQAKQGRADDCVACFSLALELAAGDAALARSLGSASYNMGARLFNAGAFAPAAKLLNLACGAAASRGLDPGARAARTKVLAACLGRCDQGVEARGAWAATVAGLLRARTERDSNGAPGPERQLEEDEEEDDDDDEEEEGSAAAAAEEEERELQAAVQGFCETNADVLRQSRRALQTLVDALAETEGLALESHLLCVVQLESEEYTRLACDQPEAGDLLHKLRHSCVARAREIVGTGSTLAAELGVEAARGVWLQCFHANYCPSCAGAAAEDEDADAAEETLAAASAQIGRALTACEEACDVLDALGVDAVQRAKAWFWRGVLEAWGAEDIERAEGNLRHALDLWSSDGDACARGLQDLAFAADWLDYAGFQRLAPRALALLTRRAPSADRLLELAGQLESRIGDASLARVLFESREALGAQSEVMVLAARFFAYDDADRGDDRHQDALLRVLHDSLANAEPESDDCHARLLFVQGMLWLAEGNRSSNVLETALAALKARAALAPAWEAAFGVTGVEWGHSRALADCLALVGLAYEFRGDPRAARYYFAQGAAMAEQLGSATLRSHFGILEARVAVKAGRADAAATALSAASCATLGPPQTLARLVSRAQLRQLTDKEHDPEDEEDEDVISAAEEALGMIAQGADATLRDEVAAVLEAIGLPAMSGSTTGAVDLARSEVQLLLSSTPAKSGRDPDERQLDRALALAETCPALTVERAQVQLELALLAARKGAWPGAVAATQTGLDLARALGNPELNRRLLRLRALALAHVGDCEAAADAALESFGLALALERMRVEHRGSADGASEDGKGGLDTELLASLYEPHLQPRGEGMRVARALASEIMPPRWVFCSMHLFAPTRELVVSRATRSGVVGAVLALDDAAVAQLGAFAALVEESESTTRGVTTDTAAQWDRTKKRQWWDSRKALDARLGDLLGAFEDAWLAPIRFLLAEDAPALDGDGRALAAKAFKAVRAKATANASPSLFEHLFSTWRAWQSSAEEVQDTLQRVMGVTDAAANRSVLDALEQSLTGANDDATSDSDSDEGAEEGTKAPAAMKVVELRAALSKAGLPTKGLKKDLVARLEEHRAAQIAKEVRQARRSCGPRGAVASGAGTGPSAAPFLSLALCEALQGVPIENVPFLRGAAVSRSPSLAFLLERIAQARASAAVARRGRAAAAGPLGAFLVDPRGDLPGTQAALGPLLRELRSKWSWEGMVGAGSRSAQSRFFKSALRERDVVLYCGHGGGEDLASREQIAALGGGCASALLMGCSSGKLSPQGLFEPAGVVLSYVVAGAPAVVGNLWDVTDKDIDRFTAAMLGRWLGAGESGTGSSGRLAQAVQESRESCKLRFLVGAAPVCVGLPGDPVAASSAL